MPHESRLQSSLLSSGILYCTVQRVTISDTVIIQFVFLKMGMLMLVNEISLYYDARSKTHQITRKYRTNFVYLLIASGEFTFFKCIKPLEAAIPILVSMHRFTRRKT
jgi:hypothetical protein